MKRIIITFLSLFALVATSNAQSNTCSQKMETLGALLSIEAKISRLSNREHTKDKLAGALIELSRINTERQLNSQLKFKDYFSEFRNECRAIEIACQAQVNAFLIAQQKSGQNSGALAEAEVIGNDYAVRSGQIAAIEEQAAIRTLLSAVQSCLGRGDTQR